MGGPSEGMFPEGGRGAAGLGAGLLFTSEVYSRSLPGTMAATLLTVSSPVPKHDPGLRTEGLA